MNEIMWICEVIVTFSIMLLFYKKYGKVGLITWVMAAGVLANIQASKIITLFGFETTHGNILFASIFMATTLINEKYGKKVADEVVGCGVLLRIFVIGTMFLTICYMPGKSDFMHEELYSLFIVNTRITIGSTISFAVSNFVNTNLYAFLKKRNLSAIVSSKISTILSQLVDCTIFYTLAFIGNIDMKSLLMISLVSFVVKFVLALLDTPFTYIAMKINREEIDAEN